MALNQQVAELDKAIEARFREHRDFEVITSMPGLGVILGAEFLTATGGDMSLLGTPDRFVGFGGVAAVPRGSGRISGSLGRPRRYNRRLQRVFYISALFSIRHCEDSRRFYERKRVEGKRHIQAVLALARRRAKPAAGNEHSALFDCYSFATAIEHLCSTGATLPEGCLQGP